MQFIIESKDIIMWTIKAIDVQKPLYLAVLEVLERDIRFGVLSPGERLPTHRALAKQVGVTLSTASRVYAEAEKRGLVTAVVGRGTFVTADSGKKSTVIDVEQGMVDWDMGIAKPLPHCDPDLRPLARKIMHKRRLPLLMSYSDPQGLPEHRAVGSDWVARFGLKAPPKDIVITAGAQHALFIICNSIFAPGDRIATDSLTYPGIKTAAQRNGLRLEGVPMDSAGMLPDGLETLCNRHNVKALYISGRIQEPTNRVMTLSRRLELKEVIRRHELLVIENDVCGFLDDAGDRTIAALVPENSIYISGLSKVFSAGLRIAYVATPGYLTASLTQGIADSMLGVSPFCAEFAAECIRSGLADDSIEQKRAALGKRVSMFRKIFTDHVYECPEKCMHIWLMLPPFWHGNSLEAAAAKHKIRIYGSEKFAVGSATPPEAVRISLTGVEDTATLRKALSTLERLVSKTGRDAAAG